MNGSHRQGPPGSMPRTATSSANRASAGLSIALIDKRPLVRHCFGRWLEENTRDCEIITVASPDEIADRVRSRRKTDLIVFSIGGARIADPGILETLHDLKQWLPDLPIIVLSDHDDGEEVAKAILHGGRGFVSTKLQQSDLAAAIHCIKAGGTFVPSEILINFVQRQRTRADSPEEAGKTPWDGLTPREMEVVARLREGKPNKVIAYELQISESTVKAFVRRILIKLHALNRTEVAHLTEGQFESIQAARSARGAAPPVEPEVRPPAIKGRED